MNMFNCADNSTSPKSLQDFQGETDEKMMILQELQKFEKREEFRRTEAEERAQRHEQRMEALAISILEQVGHLESALLVSKVHSATVDNGAEQSGSQWGNTQSGSGPSPNPIQEHNIQGSDFDSSQSTSRDGALHGIIREPLNVASNKRTSKRGNEDQDTQKSAKINEKAASQIMPSVSDPPSDVPSAASISSIEPMGPSGAGRLRKTKRTMEHAKAHLRNLRNAKAHLQNARENALMRQSTRLVNSRLRQDRREQAKASKSIIARIVGSDRFDAFFGLVIIANAFVTGFETEYQASHVGGDEPAMFAALNFMFCMVFLVELILRIFVYRTVFFIGKDWSWNVFDLIVVLGSTLEEIKRWTTFTTGTGRSRNLMAVRVLRLLRLVRLTRVVRALHGLYVLRVMVLSMLNSFRPLLWTCVLLTLLLFVNGVYITQTVNDYRSDPDNIAWLWELEYYYGSVRKTVYSLFKSISGGADWGDVAEPLSAITPWFLPYYCFLVALVCFTFLNVVTGIFVEGALKTAEKDRDFLIREEMARRHAYIAEVEVVFREADINGDGMLSYAELATHFEDDHVGAWLGTLGIDSHAGHTLFDLLDEDGQGYVDITEFVQGCFRLKGYARSIDLAVMQFEQRRLIDDLSHSLKSIEKLLMASIKESQFHRHPRTMTEPQEKKLSLL
eukprot:gnl/MRDRNA2_/MRDRNA2_78162_c0_seq1.p1 gnl/MRDRNA2_/MRDRNA2_78162_c0~~gnl/MRDRNA2_/MRDRNA2_78162_c0_seq1.p1  ORF type:complete len:674 (+),score=106.67 gnl/MRDRNA2_/MRDRNA2_78162_c0_seq1:154-2175(+)